MTTEEKVALVAGAWEEHGLEPALAAVELPKSTWYYQKNEKVSYAEKHAHLWPILAEIACNHPAYGIPRVTRELRETYGEVVNHKVVQRLLRLWDLSLLRSTHPPKPSRVRQAIGAAGEQVNLVAHLAEIGVFEVAYTDFAALGYADGTRKAYLMPIVGHTCKMAYGWAVGQHANTALAREAWERAKTTFNEQAIPYQGTIIHHDQDAVYTSYAWTGQLLLEDQVRVSYTLNGARDNPEMESFIGRFKTENRSLFLDAQSMAALREVVDQQMHYYNTERRHSSIDYVSPLAYIERARSDNLEG